jgi:hypothetical protein
VRLGWRSADTLAAEIPLKGSETLLATVVYPDGHAESLPPVCQPYSPEHAPASRLDGAAVLEALAGATGGAQVADIGGVWDAVPRERRRIEVSAAFYLLAALLFLLEVCERRTGWLAARAGQRSNGTEGAAEGVRDGKRPARNAQRPTPNAQRPLPDVKTGEKRVEAAEENPLAKAKRRADAFTKGG